MVFFVASVDFLFFSVCGSKKVLCQLFRKLIDNLIILIWFSRIRQLNKNDSVYSLYFGNCDKKNSIVSSSFRFGAGKYNTIFETWILLLFENIIHHPTSYSSPVFLNVKAVWYEFICKHEDKWRWSWCETFEWKLEKVRRLSFNK